MLNQVVGGGRRLGCFGGNLTAPRATKSSITSLSAAVNWAGSDVVAAASLRRSLLCTMSVSCLIAQEDRGHGERPGVRVNPHVWGTGVALVASLQPIATLRDNPPGLNPIPPLLELDQSEHPIRMAVLTEPIRHQAG
jgi:hypothetical protein